MDCKHQGPEDGQNRRKPQASVELDQQRRTDHGIKQMSDTEWQPIEGLALVGQRAIHEPSSGGDRMKVREVRLSPYGGQTGERHTHTDIRTVYQVEGVFVVDGRNPDRLPIYDDGAEGNEGDADEPEVAKLLTWPARCLSALFRVFLRVGRTSGTFLLQLAAALSFHERRLILWLEPNRSKR